MRAAILSLKDYCECEYPSTSLLVTDVIHLKIKKKSSLSTSGLSEITKNQND
jgi:hypothetical protein